MDYWEKPINDPTLAALWTFDEIHGEIALYSVGDIVSKLQEFNGSQY